MAIFFALGFLALLFAVFVSTLNAWAVMHALLIRVVPQLPTALRIFITTIAPVPIAIFILWGPWSAFDAFANVALVLLFLAVPAVIMNVRWLLDGARMKGQAGLKVFVLIPVILHGAMILFMLITLLVLHAA